VRRLCRLLLEIAILLLQSCAPATMGPGRNARFQGSDSKRATRFEDRVGGLRRRQLAKTPVCAAESLPNHRWASSCVVRPFRCRVDKVETAARTSRSRWNNRLKSLVPVPPPLRAQRRAPRRPPHTTVPQHRFCHLLPIATSASTHVPTKHLASTPALGRKRNHALQWPVVQYPASARPPQLRGALPRHQGRHLFRLKAHTPGCCASSARTLVSPRPLLVGASDLPE
jgi:hypothetical protein